MPKLITGSIPFNDRSNLIAGTFREVIKPGAFARSIRDDDVLAFVAHNPNKILGRTRNKSLRLWEDGNIGLRFELRPADTSYARDLVESIRRKDIAGVSFGFTATRDKWFVIGGEQIRELHEVKLHEISLVCSAAYGGSSCAVRSGSPIYRATFAAHDLKYKRLELIEREDAFSVRSSF